LESEGAEFLILGNLLIEGIQAYKAYTNYPGWDVLAVKPANARQCRIQVKSRFRTGETSFPIKNFDCEFVAFAALNRGSLRKAGIPVKAPDIFVIPVEVVRAATRGGERFAPKAELRRMERPEQYLNNWGGPNGVRGDSDDSLFAQQGIYIP
jgi:hypothetical protein